MFKLFALLCAVLCMGPAYGQVSPFGGGPLTTLPHDDNEAEIATQHELAQATARRLGLAAFKPEVSFTGNLGFPLRLGPNSKNLRARLSILSAGGGGHGDPKLRGKKIDFT
jgi:hypothetical protein